MYRLALAPIVARASRSGIGLASVSKPGVAALLSWLLGLAVAGCSLAGPSDRSFTPAVLQKSKEVDEERAAAKMKQDQETCRSQAKLRGISSVLAIIRSADKSNTDKEYIACMKKKGYGVEGEAAPPPPASN